MSGKSFHRISHQRPLATCAVKKQIWNIDFCCTSFFIHNSKDTEHLNTFNTSLMTESYKNCFLFSSFNCSVFVIAAFSALCFGNFCFYVVTRLILLLVFGRGFTSFIDLHRVGCPLWLCLQSAIFDLAFIVDTCVNKENVLYGLKCFNPFLMNAWGLLDCGSGLHYKFLKCTALRQLVVSYSIQNYYRIIIMEIFSFYL